jgi:hypothetical protein
MATITSITSGTATVSATGAVGSGVDISGITGDFTICVEVIAMTDAKTARIQFEDSVNAFTAVIPLWVAHVVGKEGDGGATFTAGTYMPTTEKQSVKSYQLRSNRFGVSAAVLRPNVTVLSASGHCTFNAWIES